MTQEIKTEGNVSDPQAVIAGAAAAPDAGTPAPAFDYPTEYQSLLARAAQTETERENYRQMALKWKKKATGSVEDDEDDEVEARVQARLAEERAAALQKEKDAMLEKALRENAELKNAVKNRPAGSPVGAPGADGPKVPDQIISPELMNYFKNVLKWDDDKVELYRTNYKAQYGR